MEWRRYVPVGARRIRARQVMDKLRKEDKDIQPIEFAAQLGVSAVTVYRWQATPGLLNLCTPAR